MPGRVRGLRKTEETSRPALAKLGKAARKGRTVRSVTPELASYVILFTTAPKLDWAAAEALESYRTR